MIAAGFLYLLYLIKYIIMISGFKHPDIYNHIYLIGSVIQGILCFKNLDGCGHVPVRKAYDRAYLHFGERLEKEFFGQDEYEDRTIEQTLDLGWKILSELPREELTRIKPEFIEKYMPEEN